MRLLFTLDSGDCLPGAAVRARPSVRAVILRTGRVAMVHSLKYDYYKFPGGGIEAGESHRDALLRETAEESGLTVIPESIREYGHVLRRESDGDGGIFLQENYYYLCEVLPDAGAQDLDDYEADERFTLEFVCPRDAITANRERPHGPKSRLMIEREARVLELLLAEGYLAD